jgi:uncharacterized protein YukJ
MPLQSPYGVWKAKVTRWDGKTNARDPHDTTPHGYLYFHDDGQGDAKAAVNVKSADTAETRLVYWKFRSPNFFNSSHPIIAELKKLKPSTFHRSSDELALDFINSSDKLFSLRDGKIPPWSTPTPGDDIVDFLDDLFKNAIEKDATLYIFGEKFDDGKGIHQIHMNQGNFYNPANPKSKGWYKENGPRQDGGILLDVGDGNWEAFFVAFASQSTETDRAGNPTGPTFQQVLETGPITPPPPPSSVRIQAAFVNPPGPDNEPILEKVRLENNGTEAVDVGNWTIGNNKGGSFPLHPLTKLPGHGGRLAFDGSQQCPLSNTGGNIVLKDKEGRTVDIVSYTKAQASAEGVWVPFH